jgi:mRNA interferase MazF
MKGDIVFVRFPYTDLTMAKPRPALVLHEERDEAVLAYILKNRFIEGLFGEVDYTLKSEINKKLAECYRL